jgi:hypothetical protein
MGATIKLDLTSDVTHLIVGSTESAKYRYVAKCREDVKVLSPSWLEALRKVWMEGHDDVDLAALEAAHRMPTFFGLKICLTGFDTRKETVTRHQTVLTRHSGATAIHPGDGRRERGRVPRRSYKGRHAPDCCHAHRQEVRACTQLADEDCLPRVVRAESRAGHGAGGGPIQPDLTGRGTRTGCVGPQRVSVAYYRQAPTRGRTKPGTESLPKKAAALGQH